MFVLIIQYFTSAEPSIFVIAIVRNPDQNASGKYPIPPPPRGGDLAFNGSVSPIFVPAEKALYFTVIFLS